MPTPQPDTRTPDRRALDELAAAEPPLAAPDLPPDAAPQRVEAVLGRLRRPVAIAGVVENGLIRPLDPVVRLPERSRVIIVASEVT